MANFGEMQANLAGYLAASDLTTEIKEGIRRAVRLYERESWWLNDAESSFVTVNGTATYSYTTAMATPLNVVLNYNGLRIVLSPIGYKELEEENVTNWRGQPVEYALFNGAFRLYPIPNGSYTVSYAYATKFASLTATTDTNALLDKAEDLIEQTALAWLLRNYKQDFDRAAQVESVIPALKSALIRESVQKTASGRLRATDF